MSTYFKPLHVVVPSAYVYKAATSPSCVDDIDSTYVENYFKTITYHGPYGYVDTCYNKIGVRIVCERPISNSGGLYYTLTVKGNVDGEVWHTHGRLYKNSFSPGDTVYFENIPLNNASRSRFVTITINIHSGGWFPTTYDTIEFVVYIGEGINDYFAGAAQRYWSNSRYAKYENGVWKVYTPFVQEVLGKGGYILVNYAYVRSVIGPYDRTPLPICKSDAAKYWKQGYEYERMSLGGVPFYVGFKCEGYHEGESGYSPTPTEDINKDIRSALYEYYQETSVAGYVNGDTWKPILGTIEGKYDPIGSIVRDCLGDYDYSYVLLNLRGAKKSSLSRLPSECERIRYWKSGVYPDLVNVKGKTYVADVPLFMWRNPLTDIDTFLVTLNRRDVEKIMGKAVYNFYSYIWSNGTYKRYYEKIAFNDSSKTGFYLVNGTILDKAKQIFDRYPVKAAVLINKPYDSVDLKGPYDHVPPSRSLEEIVWGWTPDRYEYEGDITNVTSYGYEATRNPLFPRAVYFYYYYKARWEVYFDPQWELNVAYDFYSSHRNSDMVFNIIDKIVVLGGPDKSKHKTGDPVVSRAKRYVDSDIMCAFLFIDCSNPRSEWNGWYYNPRRTIGPFKHEPPAFSDYQIVMNWKSGREVERYSVKGSDGKTYYFLRVLPCKLVTYTKEQLKEIFKKAVRNTLGGSSKKYVVEYNGKKYKLIVYDEVVDVDGPYSERPGALSLEERYQNWTSGIDKWRIPLQYNGKTFAYFWVSLRAKLIEISEPKPSQSSGEKSSGEEGSGGSVVSSPGTGGESSGGSSGGSVVPSPGTGEGGSGGEVVLAPGTGGEGSGGSSGGESGGSVVPTPTPEPGEGESGGVVPTPTPGSGGESSGGSVVPTPTPSSGGGSSGGEVVPTPSPSSGGEGSGGSVVPTPGSSGESSGGSTQTPSSGEGTGSTPTTPTQGTSPSQGTTPTQGTTPSQGTTPTPGTTPEQPQSPGTTPSQETTTSEEDNYMYVEFEAYTIWPFGIWVFLPDVGKLFLLKNRQKKVLKLEKNKTYRVYTKKRFTIFYRKFYFTGTPITVGGFLYSVTIKPVSKPPKETEYL